MGRGRKARWWFEQKRAGSEFWHHAAMQTFEGLWEDAVTECAKVKRRRPWKMKLRVIAWSQLETKDEFDQGPDGDGR